MVSLSEITGKQPDELVKVMMVDKQPSKIAVISEPGITGASAAQAVEKPATLFDDTYKGPRFRYGLNYRPLHSSHVPKDFIIWSDRKSEAFPVFGTVDYPRELTQHEIDTFELTPVPISEPVVLGDLPFYQAIEKDDILYQIWEKQKDKAIRGEIRPYTNWKSEPKENWSVMLSDGFIYYDIYPEQKAGRIIDMTTTKRRIGLGTHLVELVEQRMKSYEITKLGGSAHPTNLAARTFWSKMGFIFQDSEMVKSLS